jgi:hypothetical protein
MDAEMLNRLGSEFFDRSDGPLRPAPTMPPVNLPPFDAEAERREVAARFLEARTIKAGVECWQEIGRTNSFTAWVKIGKALQIGRDHALKTTGANRPAGQIYCKAFSAWIDKHDFSGIEKSVRSAALDLVEHLAEIESWRATLSEKRRRQLKHPLSNVAAWRKATAPRASTDPVKAAEAAWRRFVACVEALPAALLWRAASHAASMAGAT